LSKCEADIIVVVFDNDGEEDEELGCEFFVVIVVLVGVVTGVGCCGTEVGC
jgi:hypothetical protein